MARARLFTILATLAVALLTTGAIAADSAHPGEEHSVSVVPKIEEGLPTAITSLLVFVICASVLGAYVWPKISGGLEDRTNKIREEIASAEAAREQAKSALEEYEKSLAQANAEAQRMLDETKTKQAELAAELRAKADRELTQMREKAMRDIETARKAAVSEIYAESVNLATAMAGKILAREVTAGDRDRLLEESLAELDAAKN